MSEAKEKMIDAIKKGYAAWMNKPHVNDLPSKKHFTKESVTHTFAVEVVDEILAAGFVLPETPKMDPVEEEAKRLFRIVADHDKCHVQDWAAGTVLHSRYIALAEDSLARQCDAYLQGVRDRCNNGGGNCVGVGCRAVNYTAGPEVYCGDLQRAAMKKWGQE